MFITNQNCNYSDRSISLFPNTSLLGSLKPLPNQPMFRVGIVVGAAPKKVVGVKQSLDLVATTPDQSQFEIRDSEESGDICDPSFSIKSCDRNRLNSNWLKQAEETIKNTNRY